MGRKGRKREGNLSQRVPPLPFVELKKTQEAFGGFSKNTQTLSLSFKNSKTRGEHIINTPLPSKTPLPYKSLSIPYGSLKYNLLSLNF
jgi:hypothetical protein